MKVKVGNLFDSKCSTYVNTVNCVGVMGKGIAREFKKRYPQMFMEYVLKCDRGEVRPGQPYFYQDSEGNSILNFPTKDHWRSPSKLSYITDGLDWFVDNYQKYDIKSIAFPPLGCGNGGFSWHEIGPVMYQKLIKLPIDIEIYAPYGTSRNELSKAFLMGENAEEEANAKNLSDVNPKWYMILQVIRELEKRKYTLKVGKTIYQKICYVITRNGVDTGFKFTKGSYGPFSAQARDSLMILCNADMIREISLGKMISIEVIDDVKINKNDFLDTDWNAMLETADLFGRIKNTDQAELMSTVFYSYDQIKKLDTKVTDKDIYNYILEWKHWWKNKKEYEICETIQSMAMLGLINIVYSGELPEVMSFL